MFTARRKEITVFMDGLQLRNTCKPFETRAMSSYLDTIHTKAIEKETPLKGNPFKIGAHTYKL